MSIQFKPITKDNMRGAVQVRASCYLNDYRLALPIQKIESYDFEADLLAMQQWYFEPTQDQRRGYVAEKEGQVVGMVMGEHRLAQSHEAEIMYLFVSESARGLGLGAKLLGLMAAHYCGQGVERVTLKNWQALKSNGFYKHIGGEVIESFDEEKAGTPVATDRFGFKVKALLDLVPVTVIAYFSGTGGTTYAASLLQEALTAKGEIVLRRAIAKQQPRSHMPYEVFDLANVKRLVLMYPIYAFDAPQMVYEFVRSLPAAPGLLTSVISVSGGGEVWPNTKCRLRIIKSLSEKGYEVRFEDMLVMPPNMAVQAETDLIIYLMKALPVHVQRMAQAMSEGQRQRKPNRSGFSPRLWLSDLEKRGADDAAGHYRIGSACIACGWCASACPSGAIGFDGGKPLLGKGCQTCLRCYYGCPKQAIEMKQFPKLMNASYDIEAMKQMALRKPQKSIEACCKSWVWIGLRSYLKAAQIEV